MHRSIYTCRRILCLLAATAPLTVLSAEDSSGYLEHLGTDIIIIAILLSCTFLLIGFLVRLRQIGNSLFKKSRALQKNEQQTQLIGDTFQNMILFQLARSANGEFSFRYVSKGCKHVLGIERNRLMRDAKLAFDHLYEADIPFLQAAFRAAEGELAPANLEIRMLDISGNLVWLHISAVPQRENGMLVWNGFAQNISDSKTIENSLGEEKRNLQNLFETIDDLLVVCDLNGQLLHTNRSVEQRLGYSHAELAEMSLFELYPEDLRNEIFQIVALMQTEQSTTCALPLQMKNGGALPVEMNVFQGSWKNQPAIFGVARDMASRQQTENALRESEKMLQLIMDTLPMSVFWKDRDSVYLGCNKAFVEECSLTTADEVIGKTAYDLFSKETAASLILHDQQVISTNKPLFNLLQSHSRSDGNAGWREISKIPLRDEDQSAVGILGVWRDITEKKQSEERLKRTLEDMERFNQLMRGRERRTLELKGEINQLLEQLNQPIKYQTTTNGPT